MTLTKTEDIAKQAEAVTKALNEGGGTVKIRVEYFMVILQSREGNILDVHSEYLDFGTAKRTAEFLSNEYQKWSIGVREKEVEIKEILEVVA